ncbi:hypothetical protein Tco_0990232 [Tanacetum coccineum]|uniref:Uncharacterized protein n=1 Tax=Tanacetum coccineum TaxID=301880 RepID=A0ABQ5EWH5_9ASTR
MTRSTVKRLTKPLDEPEREFWRLKRAVWRLQQNKSLAIAGRNLFDAEASSSNNTGANPPTPPKTLHEHSHPNPSGFQNPITLPTKQTGRIVDSRDIWFYQNDDTPPRGNNKRKEKGEDGLEWTIRSRFEDELANFMLEKKSHTKGIGEILDQHRKELHEQLSQILSTIRKSKTPEPEAPTFAITTRSGVNTQDPSFPAPSQSTSANHTEGATEKEGPEDAEPSIMQEPAPRPSIFYQPSKSSKLPFPSRLKKQKKDDEDEKLLLIFKQIHINLPFLEAMIHMPKGSKETALKRKERGSFTLPCLIGPLTVKNDLADLGASINLMP